jgi:hypothetical protein
LVCALFTRAFGVDYQRGRAGDFRDFDGDLSFWAWKEVHLGRRLVLLLWVSRMHGVELTIHFSLSGFYLPLKKLLYTIKSLSRINAIG